MINNLNFTYKKYKNQKEINEAIKKLAKIINNDYKTKSEIILIGIMKGCSPFIFDLAKKIKNDVKFDFVFSKSYEKLKKIDNPKINFINSIDLTNKDIILVDDIIETGETINEVIKLINQGNPSSVSVAAMFAYKKRQKSKYHEYLLWDEQPKGFLVGYGFDYEEKYRNLNYIVIIRENN